MDSQKANASSEKYPLGLKIIEGKTKVLYEVKGKPGRVIVRSMDDVTAGDGARHEIIPGKGNWANQTTCNVFRLLESTSSIPLAFIEQDNVNTFIAHDCRMIPLEVVVRRKALGSYLKRNPGTERGQEFPEPVVEFYLKTKGKMWRNVKLPCDDPLLVPSGDGRFACYQPSMPIEAQEPCLVLGALDLFEAKKDAQHIPDMAQLAITAFKVIAEGWSRLHLNLVDFKVEFGFGMDGELLLADVIDNDSWRLLKPDGSHVDKQLFRDGRPLAEVAAAYQFVAEQSDLLA